MLKTNFFLKWLLNFDIEVLSLNLTKLQNDNKNQKKDVRY